MMENSQSRLPASLRQSFFIESYTRAIPQAHLYRSWGAMEGWEGVCEKFSVLFKLPT